MIVVAVPAKDLVDAKQRLVRVLAPLERAELARAMLRDSLGALATAAVGPVWVVTRDGSVSSLAREFGAKVIVEDASRGHTAAVAVAQRRALEAGARVFLTVPGDVPCLAPAEVRRLAAAAADRGPVAVFTPSRSGLGTNGAALAPPDAMALTFGEPSFANHLAAARARGLAARVLRLRGLGLDVDAPEDLGALLAEGGHTESGRLLASWEVGERLRALGRAPVR